MHTSLRRTTFRFFFGAGLRFRASNAAALPRVDVALDHSFKVHSSRANAGRRGRTEWRRLVIAINFVSATWTIHVALAAHADHLVQSLHLRFDSRRVTHPHRLTSCSLVVLPNDGRLPVVVDVVGHLVNGAEGLPPFVVGPVVDILLLPRPLLLLPLLLLGWVVVGVPCLRHLRLPDLSSLRDALAAQLVRWPVRLQTTGVAKVRHSALAALSPSARPSVALRSLLPLDDGLATVCTSQRVPTPQSTVERPVVGKTLRGIETVAHVVAVLRHSSHTI